MLLLTAVTLLIGAILVGWGLLCAPPLERLTRCPLRGAIALGEYGMLGLAALAPLGAFAHILMPLGSGVGMAVAGLGFAGLASRRRDLRTALVFGVPERQTAALIGALALIAVGSSYGFDMAYDSGLYHLQTILMAQDDRIVLGAANIHYRFGYNSLWLIVCALFKLPGLGLRTAVSVNAAVAVLVMSALLQRAGERFRLGDISPSALFATGALLLMTLGKLLRYNTGSPTTDLAAGLLTMEALLLALVAIEARRGAAQSARGLAAMTLSLPFAALAMSFKTSQGPVVLAVLPLALLYAPWRARVARRSFLAGCLCAGVIGLVWVVHGVLLSGCLLYPISASCFPALPWTIPAGVADSDLGWIRSFARIPILTREIPADDWSWVGTWVQSNHRNLLLLAIKWGYEAAAIMLVARILRPSLVRLTIERLDPPVRRAAMALAAVATLGLGYWFVSAPALRFGYGFLLAQPLLVVALLWPDARRTAGGALMLKAAPYVAPSIVVIALLVAAATVFQQRQGLFETDHPLVPKVRLAKARTRDGDRYVYPPADGQCWDAPRYCALYPMPDLRFGRLGIWRMATGK